MPATDLGVLYVDNDNNVQFGFNNFNSPETITGTPSLIQQIIIRLFTATGSDAYNPDLGSYLYTLIGSNLSSDKIPQMKTSIALAVDSVKTAFIQEQASDQSLLDNEKLSDIIVDSIKDRAVEGRWYIDLIIVTKANEMFYVQI